jgi:hypothetical protein
MLDRIDFRTQFDLSNIHAPSLLDQGHRLTLAAVYAPLRENLIGPGNTRTLLSGWKVSSVMEFSSGRRYAGLLSPACASSTFSFNQLVQSCKLLRAKRLWHQPTAI